MILRLQLLVIFSFFLVACTEDRDFDTNNNTVDIHLDNAEEITLGVLQSTFFAHLYLPVFDYLGEADLPSGSVKVENINVPNLLVGEVLSCQDFPVRTANDTGTAFYCFDSPHGGLALYSFPAEQKYVAGDRVEVRYENFVNELGWVNNGRVEARYLKTDGLSRDFVEADSISCLVNLQSDLSGQTKIDETELLMQLLNARGDELVGDVSINDVPLLSALPTRDSSMQLIDVRLSSKELNSVFSDFFGLNGTNLNDVKIIDVVGDDVRFINLVDAVKIEVYGKVQIFDELGSPVLDSGNPTFEILVDDLGEPILDTNDDVQFVQKVLATYVIGDDEKAIVINHSSETTENQIATIKVDQVYSVKNLEVEEVSCQSYERELSASLTDLSVRKDSVTYGINGSVHMVEGTMDYESFSREIRDSSFTTTVSQETSNEVYTMNDYSISYVQGSEFGSYAFDSKSGGNISSPTFPGLLEVFQNDAVYGQVRSDHPVSGRFIIFGQGLEVIFITLKEFTVFLGIDYNGDTTGNHASDVDFNIEPNWDDLINRDFIQPEEP